MSVKERIQKHKDERDLHRERKRREQEHKVATEQMDRIAHARASRAYMAELGDEASRREHFADVARDLEDYQGHLLMVTAFGGKEQAKKIAEAIEKAGFGKDTPIAFSTSRAVG